MCKKNSKFDIIAYFERFKIEINLNYCFKSVFFDKILFDNFYMNGNFIKESCVYMNIKGCSKAKQSKLLGSSEKSYLRAIYKNNCQLK